MVYTVLELLFVIWAGLVLGSFATALTWRLPRGISIVSSREEGGKAARSACPHCSAPLKPLDLIPLASWFMQKGKCRYCEAPIGIAYPLIEAATMLGCLGVYLVWGFTVPAFIIMAVVPVLVALLAIDAEHMILPNKLVAAAAVMALILIVYQWAAYGWGYGFGKQALWKLAGMAAFALTAWGVGAAMTRLLKKEALGMGDVKFFGMAGLWLGLTWLPYFMISAGFFGLLTGLFYRIALKKALFPFGPALIIALYVGLLLQGLEIVPLIGVQ